VSGRDDATSVETGESLHLPPADPHQHLPQRGAEAADQLLEVDAGVTEELGQGVLRPSWHAEPTTHDVEGFHRILDRSDRQRAVGDECDPLQPYPLFV
jgi:hypothetical protein